MGQIVHVQKLPHGCPRSPTHHLLGAGFPGLVEPPNHRGQHMAVFWMVVVTWAIQVGRHGADEVAPVLVAVGVAHFQSRDFGDGVRLVRGLQRTSQQRVFAHGLGRVLRVDARTAQKKQLLDARPSTSLNHVGLHLEVVEQEVCLVGIVRMDAAHLGCGEVHVHRPGLLQKRKHRRLLT